MNNIMMDLSHRSCGTSSNGDTSGVDESSSMSGAGDNSDDGLSPVEKGEASQENVEEQVLAKREQRAVCGLRALFFLVLICSAVAVALLTYYFTTGWEVKQFEVQFSEDSNKVLQAIGKSLSFTLEGLDSLMVSSVSIARATNQTWP